MMVYCWASIVDGRPTLTQHLAQRIVCVVGQIMCVGMGGGGGGGISTYIAYNSDIIHSTTVSYLSYTFIFLKI